MVYDHRGVITNVVPTIHDVVQRGDVVHARGSITADNPDATPLWYWRLEKRGGKWQATTLIAAWGEHSKFTVPEVPPTQPQWLTDICSLCDRIWATVPASVYVKAVWFQDAVIYDRLVAGKFLAPAELSPALEQYARQPGMGAGHVHWIAQALHQESDTVMHMLGGNSLTPEVGPWYARWEKRNGEWKIAAQVVTAGI
eukprot:TRINITY_DN791_c0_g1_i3.p1 TRINITY_DN791_c0_g1~~TRINITY_DN791_c0_g1_i3.p1  ORF type:complete len:221 (+),score=62.56 TRINITY_DN791_c0_g1_i3:71-664(+)